jgi:hypothetical protein
MPTTTIPSQLAQLVSGAVAPAALITSSAILLSGYTSKHASLAQQVRLLTNELRSAPEPTERTESVRRQLVWFRMRVELLWAATAALSAALLLFLITIFAVLFVERNDRLSTLGAVTLIAGLGGIATAVGLDLSEIVIARRTMDEELGGVTRRMLAGPLSASEPAPGTPIRNAGEPGHSAE